MASFDENGKYIKTNWKAGDKITSTKLNKIEESIEAVNDNDISRHVEADTRLDALEAKDVAHDKELTNIKKTIADNKAAAELGDYDINSRMTFLEEELNEGIEALNEGIEEVHNVASTVDGKIATAEANMTNAVNTAKDEMASQVNAAQAEMTIQVNLAKDDMRTQVNTAQANMTAQVNKGKADMEAMVAAVETELEDINNRLNSIDITTGIVNVKDFGAVGDCIPGDWYTMPTGTDDTVAIQNAFDYASSNGLKLIFEPKHYLITDTLNFTTKCNIDFSGADIIPFICEINKPTILCASQNRSKWSNLHINGRGMLQNGIQFTKPDNQAMELDKIKIVGCRHGLYLNESECINRIIFRNCDFSSNLIAGIYFKSFDSEWGHSAPVHFEKCICNANGIPKWISSSQTYNGVTVLGDDSIYGYQVYFKGFTLLNWLDGQISNHGDHKNISLAWFHNVNGLTFSGDVEDCDCLVDFDGNDLDIVNNTDPDLGNVVYLRSVDTAKVTIMSSYNLNSTGVLACRWGVGTHVYEVMSPNPNSTYCCRVLNPTDLSIYYKGDLCRVNDECLSLIGDWHPYKSIRSHKYTTDGVKEDVFDNTVVNSEGVYNVYPFDETNPDNNNYFNIYNIDDIDKLFIKMLVTNNSYDSDGKVFIIFYASTGDYISHELIGTRGSSGIGLYFKRFKSVTKPTNATRCKIGFCNSKSYTGTIDAHCMSPKLFEVYLIKNGY